MENVEQRKKKEKVRDLLLEPGLLVDSDDDGARRNDILNNIIKVDLKIILKVENQRKGGQGTVHQIVK